MGPWTEGGSPARGRELEVLGLVMNRCGGEGDTKSGEGLGRSWH